MIYKFEIVYQKLFYKNYIIILLFLKKVIFFLFFFFIKKPTKALGKLDPALKKSYIKKNITFV